MQDALEVPFSANAASHSQLIIQYNGKLAMPCRNLAGTGADVTLISMLM